MRCVQAALLLTARLSLTVPSSVTVSAADVSSFRGVGLTMTGTINVINRVRPQSDEVVDVETEEQKD